MLTVLEACPFFYQPNKQLCICFLLQYQELYQALRNSLHLQYEHQSIDYHLVNEYNVVHHQYPYNLEDQCLPHLIPLNLIDRPLLQAEF